MGGRQGFRSWRLASVRVEDINSLQRRDGMIGKSDSRELPSALLAGDDLQKYKYAGAFYSDELGGLAFHKRVQAR